MNESPSAIAAFHDAVAALLRDTAERVVMPRYCALAEHEIEEKAADDFVTVADREAEAMLEEGLGKIIPGLAVANSPLVKTAIAGEDANWGRVVMAVGKAGEPADRDKLSIGFGGVWAAREGQPLADYDEAPVASHLKGREIAIEIDLGLGDGRATVWTCDLTHGYIAINADYRS